MVGCHVQRGYAEKIEGVDIGTLMDEARHTVGITIVGGAPKLEVQVGQLIGGHVGCLVGDGTLKLSSLYTFLRLRNPVSR